MLSDWIRRYTYQKQKTAAALYGVQQFFLLLQIGAVFLIFHP